MCRHKEYILKMKQQGKREKDVRNRKNSANDNVSMALSVNAMAINRREIYWRCVRFSFVV